MAGDLKFAQREKPVSSGFQYKADGNQSISSVDAMADSNFESGGRARALSRGGVQTDAGKVSESLGSGFSVLREMTAQLDEHFHLVWFLSPIFEFTQSLTDITCGAVQWKCAKER